MIRPVHLAEDHSIEEGRRFQFHRLRVFAEESLTRIFHLHTSKSTFSVHYLKGPSDYLDFLSLILIPHKENREEYYQLKDINSRIETLIAFLPFQESHTIPKVLSFPGRN